MRSAVVSVVLAGALLAACASSHDAIKQKIDYGADATRKSAALDVPPDLAKPDTGNEVTVPAPKPGDANYSDFVQQQQKQAQVVATQQPAVLPAVPGIAVHRDGAQRWLVVNATPEQLWPTLREFLLKNGLRVGFEDPRIGIMETEWAENRANPDADVVQKYVGKVFPRLFDTGERDKYRIRVEPGRAAGTTDVYLTQRALVETGNNSPVAYESPGWHVAPSNPELEAEMLTQLMVFLGADAKLARAAVNQPATPRARLAQNPQGDKVIYIKDSYDAAWHRVGLALDRVGVDIVSENRDKGQYVVRARKSAAPGLFSSGGGDAKTAPTYTLGLTQADGGEVAVAIGGGDAQDGKGRDRLLTLVFDQLK